MNLIKFEPNQWFVEITNKSNGDKFWLKLYKSGNHYLSKVELIEWGTNLTKVLGGIKVQKNMPVHKFLKSQEFRNLMMQVGYRE